MACRAFRSIQLDGIGQGSRRCCVAATFLRRRSPRSGAPRLISSFWTIYAKGITRSIPGNHLVLGLVNEIRTPTVGNGSFASPADILNEFTDKVARYGSIQALRLFCRSDRPEQLLCMIQMDSGAPVAVSQFPRAFVTGNDLCTFVEVPVHFTCTHRSQGQMKIATCSDCRKHLDQGSPPSRQRG